jgi:hypothetical protein
VSSFSSPSSVNLSIVEVTAAAATAAAAAILGDFGTTMVSAKVTEAVVAAAVEAKAAAIVAAGSGGVVAAGGGRGGSPFMRSRNILSAALFSLPFEEGEGENVLAFVGVIDSIGAITRAGAGGRGLGRSRGSGARNDFGLLNDPAISLLCPSVCVKSSGVTSRRVPWVSLGPPCDCENRSGDAAPMLVNGA